MKTDRVPPAVSALGTINIQAWYSVQRAGCRTVDEILTHLATLGFDNADLPAVPLALCGFVLTDDDVFVRYDTIPTKKIRHRFYTPAVSAALALRWEVRRWQEEDREFFDRQFIPQEDLSDYVDQKEADNGDLFTKSPAK